MRVRSITGEEAGEAWVKDGASMKGTCNRPIQIMAILLGTSQPCPS